MPLHIQYRPENLDQIIGNESTVESLKAIFDRKSDWPHTYLFQGPKGCGKSTFGKIVAEFLLDMKIEDSKFDFVQIDGGDIKAETVKTIKDNIKYKPQTAKNRVYLIEEAHMIGSGGDSKKNIPQNNLLTTLEESPKHTYFILTTTDPDRLLGAIRSRSTTYEVRPLRNTQMKVLLNNILEKENVDDIPEDIIKTIIEASEGEPREALKTLDQIIDMPLDKMKEAIQSFKKIEKNIFDLTNALLAGCKWTEVRKILSGMDLSNAENTRLAIVGVMASKVMRKDCPTAGLVYEEFKNHFYDGKNALIMACYKVCVILDS